MTIHSYVTAPSPEQRRRFTSRNDPTRGTVIARLPPRTQTSERASRALLLELGVDVSPKQRRISSDAFLWCWLKALAISHVGILGASELPPGELDRLHTAVSTAGAQLWLPDALVIGDVIHLDQSDRPPISRRRHQPPTGHVVPLDWRPWAGLASGLYARGIRTDRIERLLVRHSAPDGSSLRIGRTTINCDPDLRLRVRAARNWCTLADEEWPRHGVAESRPLVTGDAHGAAWNATQIRIHARRRLHAIGRPDLAEANW